MSRSAERESPHLEEGELHAWLDGALDALGSTRAEEARAHLRRCARCREALVAEERTRARALEILSRSPGAPELPPFERLLERARGAGPAGAEDGPPTSGRRRRFSRLGWAASVVVALGAGWLARELGLHPDGAPRSPVAVEPVPAAATSPRAAPPGGAASVGVGVVTVPVAEAIEAVESPLREGRTAAVEAVEEPAARPGGASRDGFDVALALGPVAPREVDVALPAPAMSVAIAAEPPAPSARSSMPGGDFVAGSGVEDPLPPEELGFGFGSSRSGSRRDGARAARTFSTISAAPAPGLGIRLPARDTVAGRSPRAMGATVTADLDEAVGLTVPGLQVLTVEWTEVSPGQRGLRVLQSLVGGDTLEVRFVRSSAADGADPLASLVEAPLRSGWSQVVKIHRDGWLVARAPLPRAELEALLVGTGTR